MLFVEATSFLDILCYYMGIFPFKYNVLEKKYSTKNTLFCAILKFIIFTGIFLYLIYYFLARLKQNYTIYILILIVQCISLINWFIYDSIQLLEIILKSKRYCLALNLLIDTDKCNLFDSEKILKKYKLIKKKVKRNIILTFIYASYNIFIYLTGVQFLLSTHTISIIIYYGFHVSMIILQNLHFLHVFDVIVLFYELIQEILNSTTVKYNNLRTILECFITTKKIIRNLVYAQSIQWVMRLLLLLMSCEVVLYSIYLFFFYASQLQNESNKQILHGYSSDFVLSLSFLSCCKLTTLNSQVCLLIVYKYFFNKKSLIVNLDT